MKSDGNEIYEQRVMIQILQDRIQCCKYIQRIWNKEKKRTTQATETVNKTERTRNQSIIKPERIANTERQMKWFNMMSSNISTETHTTGSDKQKVRK